VSGYPWKSFWCQRGREIFLTDKGYLADPDNRGSYCNPHLVPFEQITAEPCLVLLGEPGIGKSNAFATYVLETQQRCDAEIRCLPFDLRAYNSEQRLQRALFEHPEVVCWQRDASILHLFLDSLDESLLHVDTVTDMIVEELERWPSERLFLRIACRTADWRPSFEERLKQIWGHNAVDVFELAPLRRMDVRIAAQREVGTPDAFLREVDRVAAVPLAIKPVTLSLLLNTYRRQGTLPSTQREVYERGCTLLCEETNPRRQESRLTGNFTPNQRLQAAERLAVMTIFANRYAVWTGTDRGDVPEADITLRTCAGETGHEEHFTEPALKEALTTGLFRARGTQELGWAHQTYAEFLAARCLTRTMSVEQIETLIRHPGDPQGKLIPQLYETAAWIACMEPHIFRAIMHIEPEVLLRSDVATADERDQAHLVDALLSYYEVEGALDDFHRNASRYHKLAQPGLALQLEPYLRDTTRGHIARRVAIEIAEACQERDLVDALLRVALDGTEKHDIRVSATHAAGQLGNDAAKVQLKPLLADPNDADDELKGITLQTLWPQCLSAGELFATLTVPQNPHLIGMYKHFLSSSQLVEHLDQTDLPTALAWAGRQARVQHPTISNLVDGILLLAWQFLEVPEIAQAFAQIVKERFEQHAAMVGGEMFPSSARADQRYAQTFMHSLREDAGRRYLLVETLLPLWQESSPALSALIFSSTPIVYEEDMPWLLERLQQEANESMQHKLVLLINWLFREWLPAHVEAVCGASLTLPLLAQAFSRLLEPIPLHSPEAQELKRAYYARQERQRPPAKPVPLDPTPAVMVRQLLEQYESDHLDAWWQLNRVLTIEPESTHYGNELAADLTTLPGWQEANEPTRTRIVEAARHYIFARAHQAQNMLQERLHTWIGKSLTIDFPFYSGYRAFLLLLRERPKLLEKIPPIVWQQWAPMLASYPLQLNDAAIEYHNLLIQTAYHYASAEIIATCLASIDQQNPELHALNCLHLVEACWDSQLEDALLNKAQETALDGACLQNVLSVIVSHNRERAGTIAKTLLQKAYTTGNYEKASVIAGVLIASPPDASWEYIWPLLEQNETFARVIFLSLQRTEALEHALLQHLTPDQVADLFLHVVELFPPAEDPPEPSGFVSDRQLLSIWRSQLITFLQQRGTSEGCAALRTILLAHPEMEWIRWMVVDAERLMRRSTWSGFNPEAILAMARDKERRLVQNGEQLLAVIRESLLRLQETLHGETPARIFLWNEIPDGNGKKRYQPKDENSLSDYVKLHLERDLKERGIIVLREVEIRRSTVGGESGERTDLYIEAYLPGSNHMKIDTLTVIIEVKGCWHKEINRAMQTQLVERYLRENSCQHGLYLVGWFNCPQWDRSDYRKADAPRITLEEARSRYQFQAELLTEQSPARLLVRSFVLDIALR
jgi:predicted NACHT family NTPase